MINKKSNKSNIYKNKINLSIFTFSRAFFLCSLLLTGIITSRLLGPESRGAYSLFFTSVGLGLNFTNIGLSQSNIFFLNKKKIDTSYIAGNSLFFGFCILIIGFAIYFLSNFFNITISNFSILFENKFLLLICIVCGLLEASFSGIILGLHKLKFQSINQIILSSFILLSTVLIYFFNNAESAIIFRSIAVLIHIFLFLYLIFSDLKLETLKVNLDLLKKQLAFGSKNWIQNIIGLVNNKGTIFFVASFSNFRELGFLSVSLLFSELIRFLPDTIGTLLLPRITTSISSKEPSYLTSKLCRITLFAVTFIGIIVILNLAFTIKTIFGNSYLPAYIPSIIVIFGAISNSIYQILTRFFTSQNMQQYSIFSSLLGLLVSFLIGFITIPQLGSIGGALSYCAGALSTSFLMIILFCKYTKIKPYNLLTISKADIKTIYNLF